ncbi:MAG: hypothetical protein WKF95_07980 [Rubrobacter sp.]
MERAGIGSIVWYPGVLAAGLAGGFAGNSSTALLFAVVDEALFYFLSLCFTALIAALCAVFSGNALAGDGRSGRLWSVVGVSEVAGILVALANLAFVYGVGDRGGFAEISLGQQMTFSTGLISLVSGVATLGLRRPPLTRGAVAPKDAKSAVLLIVLALLLVISGVVIDGISSPVA